MRYWWVSQNQTYLHELRGGYLWSPKVNKNGERNHFYDNMKEIGRGDVVFSFVDTYIKAIGVATGEAFTAAKPEEFGSVGSYWSSEGWLVPVSFSELQTPLHPKTHIEVLRPTLPTRYSPIRPDGGGNQIYLAEVPLPMALELSRLLNGQLERIVDQTPSFEATENQDETEQKRLISDEKIPETEKLQLVLARRGQGLFKSRVSLREQCCRVSGVATIQYLIASHIKPWSKSGNAEKLDGNNGLLLAPHIDFCFDKGLISFSKVGQILLSPKLSPDVLQKWHIDPKVNVGTFSDEQDFYLEYHRKNIFIHDAAPPTGAPRQMPLPNIIG